MASVAERSAGGKGRVATLKYEFPSDSNATHFALDVAGEQGLAIVPVEVEEAFVVVRPYTGATEKIKELAERYGGEAVIEISYE